MSNLRKENELELGSFGDYLLKSRIVPEKYARYYVGWVRRFLSQKPERVAAALEDRIAVFLDHLRYQVEPWQLDQAEKAVRLYFSNHLSLSAAETAVAEIVPDASGHVREADVSDAVRRLIRLRHYTTANAQSSVVGLGVLARPQAGCKTGRPGGSALPGTPTGNANVQGKRDAGESGDVFVSTTKARRHGGEGIGGDWGRVQDPTNPEAPETKTSAPRRNGGRDEREYDPRTGLPVIAVLTRAQTSRIVRGAGQRRGTGGSFPTPNSPTPNSQQRQGWRL